MNKVRIPCCAKTDRITYALIGLGALALLGGGFAHEADKPQSGMFVTIGTILVLLGSSIFLFAWATAALGVRDDRIIQYYFGISFRSVMLDEVESAEVQAWGRSFRGFVTGRGPYLSLTLKTKNGRTVGFEGLRSDAEPVFRAIVARYSKEKLSQFPETSRRPINS